eukprot:scaffold13333_cov32-Tisochrysis_lutea.AAC.4
MALKLASGVVLHRHTAEAAPVRPQLLHRTVTRGFGVDPRATQTMGAPGEGCTAPLSTEHLDHVTRDVLPVERVHLEPHTWRPTHRRDETVVDTRESQPNGHLFAVVVEKVVQDWREGNEAVGGFVVGHAKRRCVIACTALYQVGPPVVHLRGLLDAVKVIDV